MPHVDEILWQRLEHELLALDRPALVALIRSLFDRSPDTCAFLATRFPRIVSPATPLDHARQQVRASVAIQDDGHVVLDFDAARRVAQEYHTASGDLVGTVDLLLTAVNAGVAFGELIVDDQTRYDELLDLLQDACTLLGTPEAAPTLDRVCPQLLAIIRQAALLGEGAADAMADLVFGLPGMIEAQDSADSR